MSDNTYLWTWEGGLYLATVIDLASRRVVGHGRPHAQRARLRRPGLGDRHPPPGTGADLPLRPRAVLGLRSLRAFFSSLKLALIDKRAWATRAQVRRAVVDYTEVFFNRRRLHSSLNYLTPVEYEERIHHHKAAQAA